MSVLLQPAQAELPAQGVPERVVAELDAAELKAWKSLAGYKFWMFGYFAARWVFLNALGGLKRPNPFRPLVHAAKAALRARGEPVGAQAGSSDHEDPEAL